MTDIQLQLHGPLRLTRNGQTVDGFHSDKIRALLAYLVLEAEQQPVSRDAMAHLLWPGYNSASARTSLRTALSNLRRALSPLELLRADRKTIAFDSSHSEFFCDALEARRIIRRMEGGDLLPARQRAALLQRLAELTQHEFLADLSVDDSPDFTLWKHQWQAGIREKLAAWEGEQTALPDSALSDLPALPSAFVGREDELAQLHHWAYSERCRVIGVWGMGGQGKTTLAAVFAQEAERETAAAPFLRFQHILWFSLVNAPPLEELLESWVHKLSDYQITVLPEGREQRLALVVELLRRARCLLVLDNLESILDSGRRAGHFLPGYEEYEQLLQRIAQTRHHSCLLLTSREQPRAFERIADRSRAVRSIPLDGLPTGAAAELLRHQRVQVHNPALPALIERYSGNPLALLLVAHTVQELFGGDPQPFLAAEAVVFDDVRDVLDVQFERLLPLELDLLCWLAILREPVHIQQLQDYLPGVPPTYRILEALRSLQRRFLVEQAHGRIGLQNVVLEYVTQRLIETTVREIRAGAPCRLHSYGLMLARCKEYVRQSQTRRLLQPVAGQLTAAWGMDGTEGQLRGLLEQLRQGADGCPLPADSYAPANLLHLLLALSCDVRGISLEGLPLRQAYLREAELPDVSLAGAKLAGSLFVESMGPVQAVTVNPFSGHLAAGLVDGTVRIWSMSDYRLHRSFQAHRGGLRALLYSPDGALLASGGLNGCVHLWEADSGQLRHILHAGNAVITSLAFSADGRRVAGGGESEQFHIWDTESGALLHAQATGGNVWGLAFHRGDKAVINGTSDGHILVWDVVTGARQEVRPGHRNVVRALAYHPASGLLGSSGDDAEILLWDGESGHVRHRLPADGRVASLAFHPSGRILASGGIDPLIRLWDTHSGELLRVLPGHTGLISSLAFNADGSLLASGGVDQTVALWETESGHLRYTFAGHPVALFSIAVHPQRGLLASAGTDPRVRLWQLDGTAGGPRSLVGHTRPVNAAAFSGDGGLVAAAGDDGTVCLWDTDTGRPVHCLDVKTGKLFAVAFQPGGTHLACAGDGGMLSLWDIPTGRQRAVMQGHTNPIGNLAFSPDGSLLFSAGEDNSVRVWRVTESGALEALRTCPIPHTERGISVCVAVHPLGRLAACAGMGQIYLVETGSGRAVTTLEGHSGWVSSLAYSPDGQWLASGGNDGVVRLWDGESGALCHTLHTETDVILSVCFGSDQRLFSAGIRGVINEWDVRSGQLVTSRRPPGPYAGMNIRGVTGISEAQRASLLALGAVE